MDEKLQILKDNLQTLCDNVIDIGIKNDSQLSFTLENIQPNSITQIDNFVQEFYEQDWKWGRYELFNNNFKGTADYPDKVNKVL